MIGIACHEYLADDFDDDDDGNFIYNTPTLHVR